MLASCSKSEAGTPLAAAAAAAADSGGEEGRSPPPPPPPRTSTNGCGVPTYAVCSVGSTRYPATIDLGSSLRSEMVSRAHCEARAPSSSR